MVGDLPVGVTWNEDRVAREPLEIATQYEEVSGHGVIQHEPGVRGRLRDTGSNRPGMSALLATIRSGSGDECHA